MRRRWPKPRLARRARTRDERERDAINLRILRGEAGELNFAVVYRHAQGFRCVTPTPESAANDLFAQELRAECANAENMRDCVRILAFGEHGHADYTLYVLAG